MIKSYKIRLYPTKEQEAKMWQHIGACRYIWNWMLAKQEELHEAGEKHLSGFSMMGLLKPLKNDGEHEWLYEASNASLQTVCRDLDDAYKRFFKKQGGFPKFKSRKRSKSNYPIRCNALYFTDDGRANIEKIGKIKYKTDFDLPIGRGCKFTNPRISNVNGKWMLSFGMECENQAPTLNDDAMGIDVGIKETMVVAYGDKSVVFHNINKSKKVRGIKRRMRHLQRSISRKYETNKQGNAFVKTNNIARSEDKLRRMHERLTDIRMNYIHQCTHELVSLLPKRVVMEDLNVAGMMKNKHLAKAIQEQNFAEIIRQMQYKCEWLSIPFVQVGRFYPSSKTCSHCGCIHKGLKLKDRTFVCPECGFTIDRDYNAALNLMRYEA